MKLAHVQLGLAGMRSKELTDADLLVRQEGRICLVF